MKLPTKLVDRIVAHFSASKPHVRVGDDNAPYMDRWMLFPFNRFCNVYLHRMHRSDDDRACHDHPFHFVSYIIRGGYFEFCLDPFVPALHHIVMREEGSFAFRRAEHAHRVKLHERLGADAQGDLFNSERESWSVCLIGPKVREWGFHCPKGWVPHYLFTQPTAGCNKVGRGCE